MPEIVAFGEALLRLSTQSGERLETATELDVHVAGAESNVAVTVSRLGGDAVWMSKVPESPLGRRVQSELARHGVTPKVALASDGRQGVYFLEPGQRPRDTTVLYDRDDAAITDVSPDEFDDEAIANADVFFTTGITPALSESARETAETLLSSAVQHGTTVAFDLNYRRKLWAPTQAATVLSDLLPMVDLLFAPVRDLETIFGIDEDPEQAAKTIYQRFDCETVVVTLGADGALAYTGEAVQTRPAIQTNTRDPVGTGDAFVGGYLIQFLQGQTVGRALEYGAATAALKRTIAGDLAVVTPTDVEAVLTDGSTRIDR